MKVTPLWLLVIEFTLEYLNTGTHYKLETRPYMDLTRVGIFGGSSGGQSALGGLLFHPEFYKAGVASCGCHDNRMDKIWWNEQWMGFPIGKEYAAFFVGAKL